MQKVWHRAHDNWWYATIRESGARKQYKLIKGPDNPEHRKLAEKELIKTLADRDDQGDNDATDPPAWLTVDHVVTGFLNHSRKEHNEDTYKWYRSMIEGFNERFGHFRIRQLRKKHVKAWAKMKGYNSKSQNKFIGAIKRAFNWAVEEEHITRSPIAHVRKPPSLSRDRILEPDERDLILRSIRDQAFRDFVTALQHGARPGEIRRVTAADVDLKRGVWVLAKHKTAKKTHRPKIIYLTPSMVELTRVLMVKNPEGPHLSQQVWETVDEERDLPSLQAVANQKSTAQGRRGVHKPAHLRH